MGRANHTTAVAYIALFLALSAGGAMAAGKLTKNSVGSRQLKKSSITTAKIKKDAVTGAKVKDGSLTGSDLADGTITGAKVADGSLSEADIGGGVRASNVTGIAIGGNCQQIVPFPAGVSATELQDTVAGCTSRRASTNARRRRRSVSGLGKCYCSRPEPCRSCEIRIDGTTSTSSSSSKGRRSTSRST